MKIGHTTKIRIIHVTETDGMIDGEIEAGQETEIEITLIGCGILVVDEITIVAIKIVEETIIIDDDDRNQRISKRR